MYSDYSFKGCLASTAKLTIGAVDSDCECDWSGDRFVLGKLYFGLLIFSYNYYIAEGFCLSTSLLQRSEYIRLR